MTFARMLFMWFWTVLMVIPSSSPIVGFDIPWARSATISVSRRVSGEVPLPAVFHLLVFIAMFIPGPAYPLHGSEPSRSIHMWHGRTVHWAHGFGR